jgi:hypothetical protein
VILQSCDIGYNTLCLKKVKTLVLQDQCILESFFDNHALPALESLVFSSVSIVDYKNIQKVLYIAGLTSSVNLKNIEVYCYPVLIGIDKLKQIERVRFEFKGLCVQEDVYNIILSNVIKIKACNNVDPGKLREAYISIDGYRRYSFSIDSNTNIKDSPPC